VQFVDIVSCNFFSPAVLVDVVDAHDTTAASVPVGCVVDGLAT
jgi:hypothetical protein